MNLYARQPPPPPPPSPPLVPPPQPPPAHLQNSARLAALARFRLHTNPGLVRHVRELAQSQTQRLMLPPLAATPSLPPFSATALQLVEADMPRRSALFDLAQLVQQRQRQQLQATSHAVTPKSTDP